MDRHRRPRGRFGLTLVGTLLMVAATATANTTGTTQDGPGLGPLVLPEGGAAPAPEAAPVPARTTPVKSTEAPVKTVAPVDPPKTASKPTGSVAETTLPATTIEPVDTSLDTSHDNGLDSGADSTSVAAVEPLFPLPAAETPVVESRWSERALPGAGTAPEVGELGISGEGASEALEVGASLAGVILLIWGLRYMIRRSRGETAGSRLLAGGRAPSGVASILARYPVARGQQVVLLEVGQRILVTHQSAGTMTTLSEITDPEELADLRARITGVDRVEREQPFNRALSSSLEKTPTRDALSSVEGLPGLVAETVDLTRSRPRVRRFSGGAA